MLLKYLYLPYGTLFDHKMISDVYAYAYTRFPFKMMEQFRQAERDARENKRGLWGKDKIPLLASPFQWQIESTIKQRTKELLEKK